MRLKVLISAYACEPGKGSEPGVGWNLAIHLAKHHDVWLLTRSNNRLAIENELARNPVPGIRFIYHDLPAWARFWKRGERGLHFYYYLWQLTAIPLVRKLHKEIHFDLLHHATFVKYWAPSALAFVPGAPFVWGPVGGGESAPLNFWPSLGLRGLIYELARTVARTIAEFDPLVRRTARRADLALGTTPETAKRLQRLGARRTQILGVSAIAQEDYATLAELPLPEQEPLRLVSIGRLLALKGFHLGIIAFARAGLADAEYWVIGEGPERRRLERLARKLGVAERVRFLGKFPRSEVLKQLARTHALVHPSLHDSGGWVCIEAMAAGRPIICFDLGGPGLLVSGGVGIKIAAHNPRQAVYDLAEAMRCLAEESASRTAMGQCGRHRAYSNFVWNGQAEAVGVIYQNLLQRGKTV